MIDQKTIDFLKKECVGFFAPQAFTQMYLESEMTKQLHDCRSHQQLLIYYESGNYHFTLLNRIKEVKKYPIFNGDAFYVCVLIDLDRLELWKFPSEQEIRYKQF